MCLSWFSCTLTLCGWLNTLIKCEPKWTECEELILLSVMCMTAFKPPIIIIRSSNIHIARKVLVGHFQETERIFTPASFQPNKYQSSERLRHHFLNSSDSTRLLHKLKNSAKGKVKVYLFIYNFFN